MAAQPVIVGGTYDWFLNGVTINSRSAPGTFAVWDITGATVTISFVYYGNGSAGQQFTATVLDGAAGTAHYVNLTSLFDAAGSWGVSWRVSLSGTVLESGITTFEVKASGAAL